MNSHTTSLALIETEALTPADKSARVVSVALETCPAAVVARRLGCTPDRVRQWTRPGQGSPRLAQVFASPERFALRLLALAGGVYASEVVEAPVRERLWCCTVALGRCLSLTAGRELERMRQGWADVHSESGKGLAEVDRELLRRAGVVKPGADKGAR